MQGFNRTKILNKSRITVRQFFLPNIPIPKFSISNLVLIKFPFKFTTRKHYFQPNWTPFCWNIWTRKFKILVYKNHIPLMSSFGNGFILSMANKFFPSSSHNSIVGPIIFFRNTKLSRQFFIGFSKSPKASSDKTQK